jgi:hypothetical protein
MSMKMINLEKLPRKTLIELCRTYSRNWQTLDGLWFGHVEAEFGLDAAIKLDLKNWEKMAVMEARRIKKVLCLDKGGLTSILTVLSLMSWQLTSSLFEIESESPDRIIFRYLQCSVQEGRDRLNKLQFPCKNMKFTLLSGIIRVIEPRAKVRCLSCPPDREDPSCWCRWS